MNRKTVKIIKVMFSDIPKITVPVKNINGHEEIKSENFRPYLQIFKDSKIAFNSLSNNIVPSFVSTDLTIWFDINLSVKEDMLIRCKHYHSNEIRYPVFRIMLHTGFFFDNVLRIYKRFMDLSPNVTLDESFFIDIFFSEDPDTEENQEEKSPADEIETNVKNLIQDKDYSFIIEECNSRLKEKTETKSEFSFQLSKILSSRNPNNRSSEKAFGIGEEGISVAQKLQEEIKEKEEILKTLKEKDEHKDTEEQEHDPQKEQKELIKKIIEVDHEDEPEENVDDYLAKLEEA